MAFYCPPTAFHSFSHSRTQMHQIIHNGCLSCLFRGALGILLLMMSLVPTSQAQTSEPTGQEISDPTIVGVNTTKSHTLLIPYDNQEQAQQHEAASSAYYQSLNGTWKFHFSENPEARPEGFYSDDYDASNWDEITVPGDWQMQGYDLPIYLNHPYEFTTAEGASQLPLTTDSREVRTPNPPPFLPNGIRWGRTAAPSPCLRTGLTGK